MRKNKSLIFFNFPLGWPYNYYTNYTKFLKSFVYKGLSGVVRWFFLHSNYTRSSVEVLRHEMHASDWQGVPVLALLSSYIDEIREY
mgnify:CR=1 FL=1